MAKKKYPIWVQTKTHEKIHDDFKVFLWWLWKQLGLPSPTEAQYEMADYLQNGPKRRMIMAFRGVGKSWITAAFVIWCLMRNPNERIMVVSASEYKALEFATFTKQCIEIFPLLGWLRPNRGQRDSTLAFDVGPSGPAQAPSVRAVGITGQMTGGRASKVIFDDIEVPNNSGTEAKREVLELRSKEMGGAILMPKVGEIIGLGTPQSVQTVYNKFEVRGYEIRIWPARYPTQEQRLAYANRLAPGIARRLDDNPVLVGRPTDPARFDEQDLMEREAEYGRSGFALQFMLDTSLSDANKYPLKFRDLIVTDVDSKLAASDLVWAGGPKQAIDGLPNVGLAGDRFHEPMYASDDFREYEGKVMVIDPSGRGSDETAYCVAFSLHGRVYIKRWGGLAGGYDEDTLTRLAQIAKEEEVNLIKLEDNFGDGMFTALFKPVLQNIYKVTVEEYKVSGQKELRVIDKLEPAFNQHRVVMDRKLVEEQDLYLPDVGEEKKFLYNSFYQMAFLTRERGALGHDDRIEVLSEAVGHFVRSVERDTQKAAERSRERVLDSELERFMKSVKGLKPAKSPGARRRHVGRKVGRR